MRRHVLPFLFLLILTAGILYFLTNTTWLVKLAVPEFDAAYLKGYEIERFSVERQRYSHPDVFTFHNVAISLRKGKTVYEIHIAELKLSEVYASWKADRRVNAAMKGLAIQWPLARVKNAEVKAALFFKGGQPVAAEGVFRGASAAVGNYEFQRLSGYLKINRNKLELLDLEGQAFGGRASGQIMNDFRAGMEYIFWMEFKGFDAAEIARVNPFAFSYLEGKLDGTFRATGDSGEIKMADVTISRGITIKTGLAGTIRGFLSRENALAAYDSILDQAGSAVFDHASAHLRQDPGGRVILDFRLKKEDPPLTIRGQQVFDTGEGLRQFFQAGGL